MIASSKAQNTMLVIVIFAFLIAGAIFLLTAIGTNYFLLSEVNTMVQDSDFNQVAKDTSSAALTGNSSGWDNAFLIMVGGLLLGLFVAGATIQNSPVIVIIVLLLLVFTAYAGMHINNLYDELQTETVDTIDFQTNFPKSHLIMNNIVLVVTGGAALFGLGVFLGEKIGL